ncbi:MAG: ribosome biogenesis GTPase Der [Verrucomicrobia bacterium]|nr:ribosome biogenesis GTPase Der [Verrucomicrobiota bacterium]
MSAPKIAIVGRPNVGKSALFNRISGKRISIVDEAEGVTRDRLYAHCDLFGSNFTLIDTGGIDPHSSALFNAEVKEQAEKAIEEADGVIFVVDRTTGPTALDQEIARLLQKQHKPICVAINKVDTIDQELSIHEFYSLALPHLFPVSATHGRGIGDLFEFLFEHLPEAPPEEEGRTKVAIVGRPNVGKSTFLNSLIQDSRCIVSPIPGTTRDSIDIQFGPYTLIDTAGIRRKNAEHEAIDKFAAIRTERAIERADICILIVDAREGITTQDKKIANSIEEAGKGCIVLLNKWDLVSGHRMEHALQAIDLEANFLRHCPKVIISAKTGRNVDKVFEEVQLVEEERKKRVPTSQLNKFLEEALQLTPPPMIRGKRLRIYYMTQVDVAPPRFLLFLNYHDLLAPHYIQYLYNRFRETFSYAGNPVLFQLKQKTKAKGRGETPDLLVTAHRSASQEENFAVYAEDWV